MLSFVCTVLQLPAFLGNFDLLYIKLLFLFLISKIMVLCVCGVYVYAYTHTHIGEVGERERHRDRGREREKEREREKGEERDRQRESELRGEAAELTSILYKLFLQRLSLYPNYFSLQGSDVIFITKTSSVWRCCCL